MTNDAIELVHRWAQELFGAGTCITDIRDSVSSSTHRAFVVTASTPAGVIQALCKCQFDETRASFGHRRGVRYEAAVYQALAGSCVPMPRFIGCRNDSGASVLVVEYIAGATPLKELADGEEIVVAVAAWLGRLHRDGSYNAHLVRHEPAYYVGWAERAGRFARDTGRFQHFVDACADAEPLLGSLASLEQTLLHGELTPGNVLVAGPDFHVVDWESAAFGPGEIDVIAISHKWPQHTQLAALAAYASARWEGSPPDDIERRFDLARLYWDLRWLGDRAEWWQQLRLRDRIPDVLATMDRLRADGRSR